jgi:hypothetical protein
MKNNGMRKKGKLGGPARLHSAAGKLATALLILAPFQPPAAAQKEPHPSADNPPVVLPNNPVQALFVQRSKKPHVAMMASSGG